MNIFRSIVVMILMSGGSASAFAETITQQIDRLSRDFKCRDSDLQSMFDMASRIVRADEQTYPDLNERFRRRASIGVRTFDSREMFEALERLSEAVCESCNYPGPAFEEKIGFGTTRYLRALERFGVTAMRTSGRLGGDPAFDSYEEFRITISFGQMSSETNRRLRPFEGRSYSGLPSGSFDHLRRYNGGVPTFQP